jgi:glucan biosynthesis protein C
MQIVQKESTDRVIFLDNIRYLMVLLVVMLHSALAYTNNAPWWTVNDENSIFIDYLLGVLDVFLMPTLFFIAGYFALPSLQQKGKWLFIRVKLKRLGIPWLLGIFLLVPIINYIHLYSRGYPTTLMSLWGKFALNFEEVLSLYTGFITSVVKFHQHHFWFISLLLVFFIVFAFLHDGRRKLLPSFFSSDKAIRCRNDRFVCTSDRSSISSHQLTRDHIHNFIFPERYFWVNSFHHACNE